jgi:hypothetical protein
MPLLASALLEGLEGVMRLPFHLLVALRTAENLS